MNSTALYTSFILFTAIGFCIWMFSETFTGVVEPWDGNLFAVVFGFSLIYGMMKPQEQLASFFGTFLGMWTGQITAIFLAPHLQAQRPWILLGVITTGIASLATGFVVASGIKLRQSFFSRN